MKVTIIGAGSVGSTIAFTLATNGTASDIVLIDVNEEKAKGEAMDILQGAPFFGSMSIIAGDYSDAVGSDIVIITSGIPRKPGQSRLELAQTNVNIMRDIASKITVYAPKAIYIIVSNPVDVMTYAFHKFSGIPENQIIGSGTILDTSRLRSRLSELYDISQSNVHAYVFGEHGDSSFITWSLANISNVPLAQYKERVHNSIKEFPELNKQEVEEYVKKSGGIVISRKGATYYAIAVSVAFIVKTIATGMDTTMTVSTMMHGEYGISDVCLSTLAIVGKSGIIGNVETPLTDEEIALLQKSANNLKEVIQSINIE